MSLPVRLKYPDEQRILTFNFTSKLADGDSVASISAVTASAGLTVSGPVLSGNLLNVRVSGGALGNDYTVIAKVLTTNGDTLEERATIEVRADAN